MKTFVLLCCNLVIDIVYNVEEAPNYPPDAEGNPVVALEIQESTSVKLGMLYIEETGTFVDRPADVPEIPEKTQLDRIEEKLDMLAEDSVNKELEQYYSEVNTALNGGV